MIKEIMIKIVDTILFWVAIVTARISFIRVVIYPFIIIIPACLLMIYAIGRWIIFWIIFIGDLALYVVYYPNHRWNTTFVSVKFWKQSSIIDTDDISDLLSEI